MATRLMRINILEYLETDLVAKMKTSYGYNFTIGKVYHNDNEINNEKSFPFLRYYLDDEVRFPLNNPGDLNKNECVLNIFGNVKGNVQVQNNNTALIEAEKLSEDIQAFFEKGNWITATKFVNLVGVKYTHGMVSHLEIIEISKPYLKSDNSYEVNIKIKLTYIQNLQQGIKQ